MNRLQSTFRTKLAVGLAVGLFFLVTTGILSVRTSHFLAENARAVVHTHEVEETIELAESQLKDLETGQRGFLLTGREEYLEPYTAATRLIGETLLKLRILTLDNPFEQERVKQLVKLKDDKLAELASTIRARRQSGPAEALKIVLTDSGKRTMDMFRDVAAEMKAEETRLLALRDEATRQSADGTQLLLIFEDLLAVLVLMGAAYGLLRSELARVAAARKVESQSRVRAGLLALSERMAGVQDVSALARNIIESLAGFVDAKVGAIYLADAESGVLKWAAGYAYQGVGAAAREFKPGDGLVGQAAAQKSPIVISEVPRDYLKIGSGLGDTDPASLSVFPFLHDGRVKGVVELGALGRLREIEIEFLASSLPSIGIAINSAQIVRQNAELLEKAQVYTEELTAQQEELRSTNEELQTQQEELRQTNEELEEQRTELEEQKIALESRNKDIEAARSEITEKAGALEKASAYKSEFLTNMSHELRTPLNSILILSKILADNVEARLTRGQVEYAQTIHSAGSDLLNLINDILDLSKIEAGKIEIRTADCDVADVAESLERQFRAQMREKGLAFKVEVSDRCPRALRTDRARIEQILKNFLSNAYKFTERGEVRLVFDRPKTDAVFSRPGLDPASSVAVTVSDTGIGVPDAKQKTIFQPFEQVDSSISRRYKGTGLGLAIAKEFAELLGGEIGLASTEGRGSEFTLFVPEVSRDVRRQSAEPAAVTPAPVASPPSARPADDRGGVSAKEKTMLIIEDDARFAGVLSQMCRDRGFKILVASSGEAGVADAERYRPSGVVLDLKLPGMFGMDVLRRLKDNPKTRHIPVHVMSVEEHSREALHLGAIGFLNKPATAESIRMALDKIEACISSETKNVLVVEDKKVERESILKLLGEGAIKAITAGTAAEALAILRAQPVDCVILDLVLPDLSGIELLRRIGGDPSVAHPPVIVYTSKDLDPAEVDALKAFSESIIVKGVKSEERLLAEVTLFLHRVVADLPTEQQRTIERVRHREEVFEGRKILVVDDDMRNVFALRSVLASKGLEIVVGKTGVEALARLEEHPDVDLVLMDIMMPEMDGYEATRRIRRHELFKNLPVIALTAKAMPGDREKCLQAGASDYLSKPVEVENLLSLLRVWLTRKRRT